MKLVNPGAEAYVPDGGGLDAALKRAHGGCLGIAAHPDDLEIFAMHGIGQCYARADLAFVGVVVTDGRGSARKDHYANFTEEQMTETRHEEQRRAAAEGKYAAQFMLRYRSNDIKGQHPPRGATLVEEIHQILLQARPAVIYTHSPFDRHHSHVAVLHAVISAVKMLYPEHRPRHIYGCEVWGSLDWLPEKLKVPLDVTPYMGLQEKLLQCHQSQVAGSKNYVGATLGRELANATYAASHELDSARGVTYALDLMPLVTEQNLGLQDFMHRCVEAFAVDLKLRGLEI